MSLTLQDILTLRQQEDFVGREQQLAFFEENLRREPTDPRRRFILSVSGQGGVGKTWLLRMFRCIAEKTAVTAWTDEAQESVPEVMGCIAEQFEDQKHPLKTFAERYKVYRQRKQEIEADPEAPQGAAALVGRTLTKGGLCLARHIIPTISPVVTELIDEEVVASWVGDFVSYVTRKIGNKDEVRLVLEPLEVLTPLFLNDLQKVAEEKPVVLFFDAYEYTGRFLDAWLRDVVKGRYGNVPVSILLVIAGHNELDRNLWAPYEGLIARLPLEPFSEEEARSYLTRKGITDERLVEVILSLSGRLPLLLSTLAAARPSDSSEVGDPSGDAVDRFLKWVEDARRRQVALDAALPRRLNRDVLAVLTGEETVDDLFEWLQRMPFVQKREAGWAYHEVVRTQMLRYKRQQSPRGWADLHGHLAGYYERLRDDLGLKEKSALRDETWQRYTLEAMYHHLCEAAHRYLTKAINGFVTAWDVSADFARRWAETMLQAGMDSGEIRVRDWGDRLVRGLEAYQKDDYPQALATLTSLLEEGNLEDKQHALILTRRGVTYVLMGRYEQALTDFNHAIELEPHDWYLYYRALLYQKMGQAGQAEADLIAAIQRALEEYRTNPHDWSNTLNLAIYQLATGAAGEAERLYREAIAAGAPVHILREALRDLEDFLILFPAHSQAQAMHNLLQAHLEQTQG